MQGSSCFVRILGALEGSLHGLQDACRVKPEVSEAATGAVVNMMRLHVRSCFSNRVLHWGTAT